MRSTNDGVLPECDDVMRPGPVPPSNSLKPSPFGLPLSPAPWGLDVGLRGEEGLVQGDRVGTKGEGSGSKVRFCPYYRSRWGGLGVRNEEGVTRLQERYARSHAEALECWEEAWTSLPVATNM